MQEYTRAIDLEMIELLRQFEAVSSNGIQHSIVASLCITDEEGLGGRCIESRQDRRNSSDEWLFALVMVLVLNTSRRGRVEGIFASVPHTCHDHHLYQARVRT